MQLLPGRAVVDPARWWVLTVFSLASFVQGLLWMTFSSVPNLSKRYYTIGDTELNFMLNEGPIAYILVSFGVARLLGRRNGIRTCIVLSSFMCMFAAALRIAPCFVSSESRSDWMWVLYVAQATNAAAAPLTQAAPGLLSQQWFPPHERSWATGIGRQSNAFGRAIGFLLALGDWSMLQLLLLELGVATVPVVCLLVVHMPAQPVSPPSEAARLVQQAHEDGTQQDSFNGVLRHCYQLLRDDTCVWALVLAFGLQMGLYGVWSGTLASVLDSMNFDSKQADWLGFGNTVAGVCGGLVVGGISGRAMFRTHLKSLLLWCSGLAAMAFLAMALLLPPIRLGSGCPYGVIVTLSAVAGMLRGALDPISFELSMELSFPVPAGITGSLLTVVVHLVMIVGLSVPGHILDDSMMIAMAATMIVCTALIGLVKEQYKREVIEHQSHSGDISHDHEAKAT